MDYPTITNAETVDNNSIIIYFSNGIKKRYDFTPLLGREEFEPLKNPPFFRNFHIEPGGYALIWNDSIDISEYELWKNGVTI